MLAAPALLMAATVQINGAGATFPYPIYSKWFSEYNKLHPDVEINYQSIGSGGGIRPRLAQTGEFGGSDRPLTGEQKSQTKIKKLPNPPPPGAAGAAPKISGGNGEPKVAP